MPERGRWTTGAVPVRMTVATPGGRHGLPAGAERQAAVQLLALVGGHGEELDFDLAHPGEGPHAPYHQGGQLVAGRPPLHGHRHHHGRLATARPHGPHHAQLTQATAQGRVLHGRGRGAHFGIGGDHGASLGKGPAGATRDYAAPSR